MLIAQPAEAGDFVPGTRGKHTVRRIRSRYRNESDRVANLTVGLWVAEESPRNERPARYAGEVEFVDGYVGKLIAELKRRDLYDDSLLVFTSDHGEALGEHNWWGHKENLYDELLHVPLVIKPPEGDASRALLERVRLELATHIDLVPTLLEMLGLPPLPGQMGRSLLGSSSDRVLVAATHQERKPIDGGNQIGEDLVMLRDDRFKLIYHRRQDRFEMYDLAADPAELVDVFSVFGAERVAWPEALREAAARLNSVDYEVWRKELTPEALEDMMNLGYISDDD